MLLFKEDLRFMTLYKIYENMHLKEDIRGEYWVDMGGNVEGADIDINDIGHEGIVLQKLMWEFTNIFDIDYEKHPKENLTDYEPEIKQFLIENGIITPENEEEYDNNPSEFTWKNYLINIDKIDHDKMLDALGLIWDLPGKIRDARDYAMKYYGDKRVAGHNIQTWQLTSTDLKAIGNGLWEINGDDIDDTEVFNIEVMNPANRAMFWDVPWEVINANDVSSLLRYKER